MKRYRQSNDELLEKIGLETRDKNELSIYIRDTEDRINQILQKHAFLSSTDKLEENGMVLKFLEIVEATLDEASEFLQDRKRNSTI